MTFLAMNILYNEKGQWPVSIVRRKNIHAVCCEDNYFPRGKFKSLHQMVCFTECTLFIQYVLFLWSICLPCAYICDVRNEYKSCVVTHRAADILVALLGLFTFARIACLLQLWIRSDLDYSIWATPQIIIKTEYQWVFQITPGWIRPGSKVEFHMCRT